MRTQLLVIASFLCGAASARADAPPPVAGGCTATGMSLFEITKVVKRQISSGSSNQLEMATMVTERSTVYESGAWTRELHDQAGKPSGHGEGCLTDAQLAPIRKELAGSPWKISKGTAACAAIGLETISYNVRGKAVWSWHLCQLEVLDIVSAKTTRDMEALIATLPAPAHERPRK